MSRQCPQCGVTLPGLLDGMSRLDVEIEGHRATERELEKVTAYAGELVGLMKRSYEARVALAALDEDDAGYLDALRTVATLDYEISAALSKER